MVKVTIENSNVVEKVEGNAIFAVVTDAKNVEQVRNIIFADGKLDKRTTIVGLADLVSSVVDSISEDGIERGFLALMFLKHFEDFVDKRMDEKKNEDALDGLMEFLRKAGI